MRVFKTSCIDNQTRREMILSETSFNEACIWLEKTVGKIFSVVSIGKNRLKIICEGCNRIFFYDEDRGYLLGE